MGCCFSHQTAKDSSVEKLLLKLNNWYLEKEGKKKKNKERKSTIFPKMYNNFICIKSNANFWTGLSSTHYFFNSLLLPELVYKSSCALTVHAISHYSPDVLKGHAGVALPLAFLGMHQAPGPDEEKGESHDATLWAEVWQENVPGEKCSYSIKEHQLIQSLGQQKKYNKCCLEVINAK